MNTPEYYKRYYQSNKDKYNKKDYCQKYYQKNKTKAIERVHRNRLKRVYKITQEQFEFMLLSQENKCAICSRQFKERREICIDHNHKTGKVRQLLCSSCNKGIGFLKENVLIFEKAIQYLAKWDKYSYERN